MTSTTAVPSRQPLRANRLLALVTAHPIVIAIAALVTYFSVTLPTFFTATTLQDVLNQAAIPAVVVFPFALLMIAGYVDLSVGATMALAATTGALVMGSTQSVWLGGLTCLLIGAGVGVVNGVGSAILGFSPIIVTLATLTAGRGLAQVIFTNAGQTIGPLPTGLTSFGTGVVIGVPVLVIVAALVLVSCDGVLRHTPTGRHLYAIGVNPRAAYLSGIRTRMIGFTLYVVVGIFVGLAALLYLTRYASVQPAILGLGFEIQVLTVVLLGGIAFTGGQGNVIGAALGLLFITILTAGLQQAAVLPATQLLLQGVALAAAAALQWWQSQARVVPQKQVPANRGPFLS